MKTTALLLLCLVFTANFCSGQNLVPNPSFEEHTACPNNGGQIEYALHWTNPLIGGGSSPDYFNVCGVTTWSVPNNVYGYEPAHSGGAYAAIATATNNPNFQPANNFREYLQVELLDSLILGTEYCIDFYVSACDSVDFVCNNIGVYFSNSQISDTQINSYPSNLKYIPQFENDISTNITSRDGWTKVSGKYTALGGEKYIVIGNFRDSITTTSIYTGWVSNLSKHFSIHYIDDITLALCDSPSNISLGHENNDNVKVYPNPTTGTVFVESFAEDIVRIEVYDSMGQKIFQENSIARANTLIELSNRPGDIYFIYLSTVSSNYFLKLIKI